MFVQSELRSGNQNGVNGYRCVQDNVRIINLKFTKPNSNYEKPRYEDEVVLMREK